MSFPLQMALSSLTSGLKLIVVDKYRHNDLSNFEENSTSNPFMDGELSRESWA